MKLLLVIAPDDADFTPLNGLLPDNCVNVMAINVQLDDERALMERTIVPAVQAIRHRFAERAAHG